MKSLTILLVEDDKIERLKFKKVCQEANFDGTILEAKNGESALNLLIENYTTFDLIVTDLNMPKMDGFEFLSTIKENSKYKYIPVVIMSTSENKFDLEKCYKLGISGYFTKPLKYIEYVNNVISLLDYWEKVSLPQRSIS